MKLLSLIALGLACAMAGRYIAYRLSRRVRILEKISLMFGIAENEIKFLNRPTSELIELLEKKDELAELDFLPKSISYINEGMDITDAWAQAIHESKSVDGEDTCVLYSFGESLGRSDANGQIASCRYHVKLTDERLNEAREKRKRYASLACGLGMLSGIGVFIILF